MKSAMFLVITGLLLTLGGVGGLENDGPLLDCTLVAVLGLAVMGSGSLMISRLDSSAV